jgi:hypothetical protein
MEEEERICRQVLERDLDDVAGARKPRMRMADWALGLEAARAQPIIGEGEAFTAVVVLEVLNSNRPPVPEDRAELRDAVGDARQELRQVERGIGIVTDSEKEHLSVEIVHPTPAEWPSA